MKTINKHIGKTSKPIGSDFFGCFWEKSWTYIKTVVDVVQDSVLILDENFKVIAANEAFYETFKVKLEDTEGEIVYKLGNEQWNIPALRNLLEDILPEQTFFKGFQVAHEFPGIGRKVMILNARQIHITNDNELEKFPNIIVLSIEDVTDMMVVAESLSNYAKEVESKIILKTKNIEMRIKELEKEINEIKKPIA